MSDEDLIRRGIAVIESGPHCECGHCDSTGRKGGPEILLPVEAWRVAGLGDTKKLAIASGHEGPYVAAGNPIEDFGSWLAVSAR